MKKSSVFLLSFAISLPLALPISLYGQNAEQIGKLFGGLSWRSIGPAIMGGRTVGLDVVEKTPWVIYAAIGPSGVWKSENNGVTWEPVFDNQGTVSAGDVTIAQSQPEIVWVGTGEATCRNSVTIGDGAYKSTDGGKTWANLGLAETRHISRIVIHPGDPNLVYVAAMGHLWGPNEERGVFRTRDGGKTWEKVLYINQDTGMADLAMDPSEPQILYAAAYDHRRFPYYFRSGGPGSGLYKTADGGKTWKKLAQDLPQGILGRIGIDVSRSNPDVVYALIEDQDAGLWRSEDKGETWARTCDNETYKMINFRPFYYSQVRIDPTDDKVVYVFSGGCYVSRDGGKKFRAISAGTHPDHHALWINPQNPLHLIDGNDGGIDLTFDGGKNWHSIQHMALAEVYQIGYDLRKPYYVYCGLQDNGTWGGPSATYDTQGIVSSDWICVGGGDGFFVQVDPADHNLIYRNSQMNGLTVFDLRVGRSKNIRPQASLHEPPWRFNWNSPILISPHDSNTVYTGGNYLFKTINRGHSWEMVSPDLSTNDPEKQKDSGGPITPDNTGAEIHCTIVTIAESPVKKGVIWCGTDDGNVQITRDGGKTWMNVVKNIPGLPPHTWCSRIEASHFEAGTAYAAFDGHRHDDYNPYVYKTTDYGESWKSIAEDLPLGWIQVIREDLKNKNLLFLGTEFSIYASLDGGTTWFSLRNNLPTAAVHDIAVHPRENDLIIGTHGRGIWILDDISPLQEMTEEVLKSDFHLFNIRPATQFFATTLGESFSRPVYAAKNPDYGLHITAYFRKKPEERPSLLIKNQKDEKAYETKLLTKDGLQRSTWNLQSIPAADDEPQVKSAAAGFFATALALPGEYSIEVNSGGMSILKRGTVLPDPRFVFAEADRAAQIETLVKILRLSKKMGLSVTAVRNIRGQLESLKKDPGIKEGLAVEAQEAVQSFEKKFSQLEEAILPKSFGYRGSMEIALRGGSLSQLAMFLGMSVGGFPQAPTETELFQLQEFTAEVDRLTNLLNEAITSDIPALNDILGKKGLKPLQPPKQVKLSD